MRSVSVLFSLVCLSCSLLNIQTHKHSEKPLVLLVSFDGFRWDYLKKFNLTNFNYLKKEGSHADFIHNSFATVTFPNHWSIVTGQYEETHGIIHNEIYDPTLKEVFESGTEESRKHKWYGQNSKTEPIWITNQKSGHDRYSAASWVGDTVSFSGQKPIAIPFDIKKPYNKLIDEFIALFTREQKPINFGALYFHEPDHTGHLYGPYSKEMKEKLNALDKTLGYLIEQLKSHHLFDKLNLIVTADHGMEEIKEKNSIYLNKYVNTTLFSAYGRPSSLNIFLENKKDLESVYEKLKEIKNIKVYKKADIPDKLHYKNNVRVGDLLIVAKLGFSIFMNKNTSFEWKKNNGGHGYMNDQSSMWPIFIAHGPAIKKDFKIPTFKSIDIYPLMCLLLGIQPAANNGAIEHVLDMVIYNKYNVGPYNHVYLLMFLIPLSLLATPLIFMCFCKFGRKADASHYTSVTQNELLLKDDMNELDDF